MNEAARRRPPSLIAAAAAAAVAALVAGCHVDAGYVYDHAHSCSSTSSAEQCGSTRAGEPMMCFAGYQLAGAGVGDFCTERCNPNASVDGAHVCLSSGAKLATCHPSGQGSNAACPYDELSCLRTDLLGDDGLCVKMPVCSVDGDCSDPSRSTCMATLVREFYGATNIPPVDHLYCLQSDCDREQSACPSGEVCLPRVLPRAANPPDICVPKCDANLNCPPNHFCYRKVSGEASPAVCIPGLLGFGCTADIDCLVGFCLSDPRLPAAARVGQCAVLCQTNEDCDRYSAGRGAFFCARLGDAGACINPASFGGSYCVEGPGADCKPGEICTHDQPILNPGTQPSECRKTCASSADCPPLYDALPRACVRGTCFPGRFYVPCESDGNCVPDLRCMVAPAIDQSPEVGAPQTSVCSYGCTSDADCDAHVLTEHLARCQDGVCRRVRGTGVPCERGDQCLSQQCAVLGSSGTEGACL